MMNNPSGLRNSGVTCWLNSLIQALLSSTIFCSTLSNTRNDESSTHEQFKLLIEMERSGNDISNISTVILRALVADLTRHRKKINMEFGQQSCSEGLILLLEMLGDSEINKRFNHVQRNTIRCLETDKVVSSVRSVNNIFYIFDEESLLKLGLRTFLLNHSTVMGKEYIPDDHQSGNTYERYYTLCRTPEIIIIALNRYMTDGKGYKNRNTQIKLPDEFTIPHKKSGEIIYNKIAEIDHFGGSTSGGHYVVRAKRNNESYLFNDEQVTPQCLGTSPNTYLTFYEVSNVDSV